MTMDDSSYSTSGLDERHGHHDDEGTIRDETLQKMKQYSAHSKPLIHPSSPTSLSAAQLSATQQSLRIACDANPP